VTYNATDEGRYTVTIRAWLDVGSTKYYSVDNIVFDLWLTADICL